MSANAPPKKVDSTIKSHGFRLDKEAAKRLPQCSLKVGESVVNPSDCVKNIGVYMDTSLTMEKHVNYVCRIAYAQLKRLSKIKCFINHESLEIILHALITARIDYCNSLYYSVNDRVLRKLQILQNACIIYPMFLALSILPQF